VGRLNTWSGSRSGLTRPGTPHPRDFGRFYLNYYPRILRFFAYHTRDAHLSLDLTAETFAKAFEAREQFRGSTTREAVGWLWVIARNELRLHHRGRAAETAALRRIGISRPEATEDELAQIVDRATLDAERGELYDAFAELTDKQREVVQMRVIDELSNEEIAQQLNVAAVVVRKRLSAALRHLAGNASVRRLGGAEE
jgi:RNA polymerase sigma-70 factor, ECF subfamily